MVCELPLSVPSYLCDYRDKLTLWGLARLFQDVASFHVDSAGLGFNTLISNGKAWVLCRICYEVDRLPKEGERVTVKTWSRGTDGLFAFRDYLLEDASGSRLAGGSSYWAVIDFDTRHVVRLHDMMAPLESCSRLATRHEQLGRLRIPKHLIPDQPRLQFPVLTSMIDHTMHVNNAEYVKWIVDALGHPLAAVDEPFELSLEYLQETHPDETVSVFAIPDKDSTYFQISNSREVKVVAKISDLKF